jgi:hypothetical protein
MLPEAHAQRLADERRVGEGVLPVPIDRVRFVAPRDPRARYGDFPLHLHRTMEDERPPFNCAQASLPSFPETPWSTSCV